MIVANRAMVLRGRCDDHGHESRVAALRAPAVMPNDPVTLYVAHRHVDPAAVEQPPGQTRRAELLAGMFDQEFEDRLRDEHGSGL